MAGGGDVSHAATNWAIQQRGLKPATKIVLWHLADCHNPAHGCFPSQDYLSEQCELSRSSLNDHLAALEARGLIRRDRQRNEATRRQERTRYRLAFEAGFEPADAEIPSPEFGHGDAAPVSENGAEPCPENTESRVRNSDTNPVREPVREPVEREGARERDGDGQPETAVPAETRGRADFDKRVQRFCSGGGYAGGTWPDWDQVSFGFIRDRFADLAPGERADAERWRDAYLLDCRDRKSKPMGLGVFLRDRAWNALEPVLLQRAERLRSAQLAPEDRAKPDGWAACLGPVGMAWLFAELLKGQPAGVVEPGGLWTENRLKAEWPAVWNWKAHLHGKGGAVFAERWHAFKGAMEAVPVGTAMHAAWIGHFERQGWPWLSAIAGHPVLYAPKGGPDGLSEFVRSIEEGQQDERGGGHAAA